MVRGVDAWWFGISLRDPGGDSGFGMGGCTGFRFGRGVALMINAYGSMALVYAGSLLSALWGPWLRSC